MTSLWNEVLAEPRLERMLAWSREREHIAEETCRRVLDGTRARVKGRSALELLLNDVCFHEQQRFRATRDVDDGDKRLRSKVSRWRRGLRHMSDAELAGALDEVVGFYVDDVLGNFSPAVFAVATRLIPVGFSLLFSPVRLGRSLADLSQLRERVLIEGTIADLVRLSRKGTLVVVPTHLSNLDSIAIGFALERARLPPCTYGAGKNLWSNPLLGFFMRNLGAYRVDRRIKHDLYKDILKEYSTVLLEGGFHSLFFPGGTRARSGAIESKLKLGLLGTALAATVNQMARGEAVRPVYIVPATINYHLTLEASTLIDDYLKEAGRSRYIIEDDESTQLTRVARYLRDMLRHEGSMTIQFSDPLDVLGHRVGPDGESFDDRGRQVSLRPFLTSGGEVKPDAARDAEYTRELAEKIVESYRADTHVLSTHLVAYVCHRALMKAAGPKPDLFRVLRGSDEEEAPLVLTEVLASIDRVKAHLAAMAEQRKVRLGASVARKDAAGLLEEALGYFALFHDKPTIRRAGEGVVVEDRALAYYYHNRLVTYGLEAVA